MASGNWLKNNFKFIAASDPIANAAYKKNDGSDAARFLYPAASTAQRLDQGDKPLEALGDPATFFTKTNKEKQAEADQIASDSAAATKAAEDSATSAANLALLARKKRRQSGLGQLSTGAQGGTAQLSTANAYGKSTLGA